jgi:hypothetical protein
MSDYELDDWAIGVRSPADTKDFSSSLCVKTCSGAHPASYPMGTGDPSPVVKGGLGMTDHSLPSSAQAPQWHVVGQL